MTPVPFTRWPATGGNPQIEKNMKFKIPATILVIVSFICLTVIVLRLSIVLYTNAAEDKAVKADYFKVNQIKYGLLSGDKWSVQVNGIIATQIDSFSFTKENKKVLTAEVDMVLYRLFDELEGFLHKKKENLRDQIKFRVISKVVDIDKFRAQVPSFSKSIVDQLDKSKNKAQVKKLLKDKITHILNNVSQDTTLEQNRILRRYGAEDIVKFNRMIADRTGLIKKQQANLSYMFIGCLVVVLLLWLALLRFKLLFAVSFLFSVIISFLALFIGINLPMIEIDARIATLDLQLLSSHVTFKEQVIFFQTKSILDVVSILMENGKVDSVFVGCLIFLFSVLFPVSKLISATYYLFRRQRSGKFVRYMAFNSGKWSMADVMVVAIFMAYVGFQNIVDNQLKDIDMKNETVNIITTNRTNLQAGFLIFVSFCLFNLALAEILKAITKQMPPKAESTQDAS